MSDNIVQLDAHRFDPADLEFICDCTNRTFIISGDGTAQCALCGVQAISGGGEITGKWYSPPEIQPEEMVPDDSEYKTLTNFSTDPAVVKARIVSAAEGKGLVFAVFGFETGGVRSVFLKDFTAAEEKKWLWRRLRRAWRNMIEGHQ
ncbi:MAG TPA: hypothetical protein ENH84_07640 [Phycisphaerae bacterium]|nr:hypothetical protein [Phycisphaerae bacterium]